MVGNSLPVVYRINAEDIIEDVNDGWVRFAMENGAPSLATDVIGRSIWDYIASPELRQIYASVFEWVRQRQCQLAFPLRCDSPELYREMRLLVSPMGQGQISLCSTIQAIRAQPCEFQLIKHRSVPVPSSCVVQMCSWCKAIEVGSMWKPIGQAIEELGILTQEVTPGVIHALCDSCRVKYIQDYVAEDAELTAEIQRLLPLVRRWFRDEPR